MLRSSVFSNLACSIWLTLANFAVLPVQISHLGAESFAFLAISASLFAFVLLTDFGFAATASREIARLYKIPFFANELANLVHTLEFVYLLICACTVLLFAGVGSFVASEWLQLQTITQKDAVYAIVLLGVQIASMLHAVLYRQTLLGLDEQKASNVWQMIAETIRLFGGVLLLLALGFAQHAAGLLKQAGSAPNRSVASVKRDVEVVQSMVRPDATT